MYYILKNNTEVINVDNDTDRDNLLASGWTQLTPAEIKAAGMEGYEQYVSPLNTKVDAKGGITFTPPSKDELDAQLAQSIRMERNAKLAETDYLVYVDYPIDAKKLSAVKEYRQALRDITEQDDFPNNVVWPEKPEV